jgi:pilus assembly protein CpaC
LGVLLTFLVLPVSAQGEGAAQGSSPAASSPASTMESSNDLSVTAGQSVLVDTAKPVSRVSVGLGDFAEATVVSPTEILVNGKKPGETSLILWEAGGARQFFNVFVRPSSAVAKDQMEGLRRELRTQLPGQKVKLTTANGLIFLSGTVKDLTSSERAVKIASTAGKVVNLLYVNVPPSKPQILLKVRFASVDRSREKQLGINIFSQGAGNTIGTTSTQQFSPPSVSVPGNEPATATLSNLLNIFVFRPDINVGATLQALETKGLVQLLAEPNLLAADGKQASFLAGGEYPYPVVQGVAGGVGGAVTIEFKEFGVRLNFIPTVTPRDTIRLQVAPEVSALDFTNAVTVSGFRIPAISERKVQTEVELKNGQSFVIGGLLNKNENETFSKVPFIGDVPVLGKLFQSIQRTKQDTELIVVVTPEIVAPIPAGAPIPALNYPHKFLPPNSSISTANPVGGATAPHAPETIPVEDLLKSMKPEKPLDVSSTSYGEGNGSGQGMTSGMTGGMSH